MEVSPHNGRLPIQPSPITFLDAFDADREEWQVVIETPKRSHNKFKHDQHRQVFILNDVLPEGMSFPYDFGFLPATLGDDGDPLDVLLLTDEPTFCGCVVPSRLIGVIEAEQTETDGQGERNDRLVAVPCKARAYANLKSLKDMDRNLLDEIEQFFVSYNRVHEKRFKVLGLHGPATAEKLAKHGMRRHNKQSGKRNGGKKKKRKK